MLDNTVWGDGGLIRTGLGAVAAAHEKLRENYAVLGARTEAAATELWKVAEMYRITESSSAAELDRTYVGGGDR